MDIDDSNAANELIPQAANQPPVSAVDAELADLFGYDISLSLPPSPAGLTSQTS